MSEAPKIIYLQWIPDKGIFDEITWCEDEINSDDIEYIKKDIVTKQLELLEDIHKAIVSDYVRELLGHPWHKLTERIEEELKR